MKVPTLEECFRIIREMQMMDHIVAHSIMVGNVARCLCRDLLQSQPDINMNRITAAALLHDITKTRSFNTGEIHSETGGRLLADMGYPEIGDIIRQHVILDHCDDTGAVSEHEIVNYADKRVLHDQVVTLSRRMAYIEARYAHDIPGSSRIRLMWDMALRLEIKLFRKLPFPPARLTDRVRPDILSPVFSDMPAASGQPSEESPPADH